MNFPTWTRNGTKNGRKKSTKVCENSFSSWWASFYVNNLHICTWLVATRHNRRCSGSVRKLVLLNARLFPTMIGSATEVFKMLGLTHRNTLLGLLVDDPCYRRFHWHYFLTMTSFTFQFVVTATFFTCTSDGPLHCLLSLDTKESEWLVLRYKCSDHWF